MTDLRAQQFTGEQWVLEERTSDPSDPVEGERWIRSDLDDGDRIAMLRVETGGEIADVPIFETGTSVDNLSEALRVQIGGVTGFVAMVPIAEAAYPELRMQHNGELYGFHDRLTEETQTFSTDSEWTVPSNADRVFVDLEGANGGGYDGEPGGVGGRVAGEIDAAPGDAIYVRIGGGGSASNDGGGDGGDAVDIRQDGDTLDDRVAVAGGGGGRGDAGFDGDSAGGDGGANTAQDGNESDNADPADAEGGSGGSQSSGGAGGSGKYSTSNGGDGSLGQGGNGGDGSIDGHAGGGGGGYYGGGGGGSDDDYGGGGGGGSNYTGGLEAVDANERGTSSESGGLATIEYYIA